MDVITAQAPVNPCYYVCLAMCVGLCYPYLDMIASDVTWQSGMEAYVQ